MVQGQEQVKKTKVSRKCSKLWWFNQ